MFENIVFLLVCFHFSAGVHRYLPTGMLEDGIIIEIAEYISPFSFPFVYSIVWGRRHPVGGVRHARSGRWATIDLVERILHNMRPLSHSVKRLTIKQAERTPILQRHMVRPGPTFHNYFRPALLGTPFSG